MAMAGICNVGSLVLGIAAWGFPLQYLIFGKKKNYSGVQMLLSMGFCSGALFLQLLGIHHRVYLSDWTALMDTIEAVVWAAAALLGGSVILNGLAHMARREDV